MSIIDAPKSMAECIECYRAAGNEMSVPRDFIAAWLINNGQWEAPFKSQLRECSQQIGDALGKATGTDPQGREFKRYVAAKGPWTDDQDGTVTQKWLWEDAMTCSRDHARKAIKSMYSNIGKDCKSLHATVEAMNENNPNLVNNPIQLSWDFTDAVEGDDDESPDPKKPR